MSQVAGKLRVQEVADRRIRGLVVHDLAQVFDQGIETGIGQPAPRDRGGEHGAGGAPRRAREDGREQRQHEVELRLERRVQSARSRPAMRW
jgi:phosphatidylserine/phosphatidylglycerophosphate/cardiolipin synthase-like enzyme